MSPEPAIAHPAATVLLLRDGTDGLEVFMVVRHRDIAFMGGALVFPGGRVDPVDAQLTASCESSGLPPESLALRVAAVRETFEEAGVLLARPVGSDGLISGDHLTALGAARQAVHANAAEFPALLARERLTLALDCLIPYAHWITPAIRPKRFDTHFFAVAAPLDHAPSHDGREAVDSRWVAPRQAIADAAAGRCQLAFATRMNLQLLLPARDVAHALAMTRARPIVTVMSAIASDGKRGPLPPEAGYGAENRER